MVCISIGAKLSSILFPFVSFFWLKNFKWMNIFYNYCRTLEGWPWSGFSILVRQPVGRWVRWTPVTQTAIYVELTWLLRSRACALSHLVEKPFLSEHNTHFWALHCTVLASRKWIEYLSLFSVWSTHPTEYSPVKRAVTPQPSTAQVVTQLGLTGDWWLVIGD